MYHEVNKINKTDYHYLVENIRTGKKKWKKIKIYLGRGKKSKKEIERLIKKHKPGLEKKAGSFLRSIDPLMTILSEKQVGELEEIRKSHLRRKMSGKIDWEKYYEWFLTQFTYNTNAIEGSSLSLIDTKLILFEDTVPKGKSLREINEVTNHRGAFDYMMDYRDNLSKRFILTIHKRLMHNILWRHAGVFRDVQVYIGGADFIPPKPGEVEGEFKKLMKWYASNKKRYHPVIVTSYFHSVFESIHPFRDGNGRVGRLIVNFILRKNGFPMIDIKNKDRKRYYKSLQSAQKGNLKPLVNLILKYIKETEF